MAKAGIGVALWSIWWKPTARRGSSRSASELPDHLPVLLEFLAHQPVVEAREILADAAHILEALRVRLTRRESNYAAVFAALVELSAEVADKEALATLLGRRRH